MADPAKLARAQHSFNLLIGLDMTVDERAAMLDRVMVRAGEAPLGEVAVDVVSRGVVEDLAETGLPDSALDALIEALYEADLSAIIGEFLVEMTGEDPGEPGEMPEPEEPEEEAPCEEPEPVEPPPWAWDAILCLFDPTTRRHTLTLLRGGGSVCSEPVPETEDGFGPLVDRISNSLHDEVDPLLAEQHSETFTTPPCPDRDALIAALLGEREAPEQLYLLTLTHALPNPCRHEVRFQLTEPGERASWQGRSQELMIGTSYRPAGLSLHAVQSRAAAAWKSPARLLEQGFDRDYRPPLLSTGPIGRIPLQSDWQLRAGWGLSVTPLHPDGPQLRVSATAAIDGEIALDGRGHLQEELGGWVGLAATVSGEDGCVHTGAEPLPEADWNHAADVGFGALSVLTRSREGRELGSSGLTLTATTRPAPGIPPRLAQSLPVALEGGLTGALRGEVIIDTLAQLADDMGDAQSTGSTAARASLPVTVRLTLSDGARSVVLHLTDPRGSTTTPGEAEEVGLDQHRTVETAEAIAGTVEVDGVPRHGLSWRTKTTTVVTEWSEPIDLLSDRDWMGGGESERETVDGRLSVTLSRVAGGYAIGEPVAEE